MPVNPTYPGVYLQEVSSGVHTITGVATSITAFIGRAQRGPTNDPQTIFGFGDYTHLWGSVGQQPHELCRTTVLSEWRQPSHYRACST